MSILLQNASAAFVQSAQPDGRYHLVIKANLVGHSELQDRLIKKIAQSRSLSRSVEVVKGMSGVPELRVHLSALEKEIAALLAAEDKSREEQKYTLGRSYSDIAADAKFVPPVDDTQGAKNGPAQGSSSGGADSKTAK